MLNFKQWINGSIVTQYDNYSIYLKIQVFNENNN